MLTPIPLPYSGVNDRRFIQRDRQWQERLELLAKAGAPADVAENICKDFWDLMAVLDTRDQEAA